MLPRTVSQLFEKALDDHKRGRIQDALSKYKAILKSHPDHPDTLHYLGLVYLQRGQIDQAILHIKKCLKFDPKNSNALSNLGYCFNILSDFKVAINYCVEAVKTDPLNHGAWTNLGNAQRSLSLRAAAHNSYLKALNLQPSNPVYIYNIANIYYDQKNFDSATKLFKKCLTIENKFPEAHNSLSACLIKIKDITAALSHANLAIELKPDYAEAWSNRGTALNDLKRFEEALTNLERAVELKADYAEAWSNRGVALNHLKRHEEALKSFDRAIELKPYLAEAWSNRGTALNALKRHEEALTNFDRAVELKADYAEAWSNRGAVLNDLKHYEAALASYDQAIELKPDHADAHSNRGGVLNVLKRHEDSATSYFRANSLRELKKFDFGQAHHQMMLSCNWTDYDAHIETLNQGIEKGEFLAEPFGYQGIGESELLLKKCSEIYCNHLFPANQGSFYFNRSRRSRIKIGYLCGEFRSQATSHLMTGVWEHHDSKKFELFGLDNGWNDDSDYRRRINRAFSNFFDISGLSDFNVAKFVSDKEIDILINLNGYFGRSRTGVFALKPAPISINYLGFPGTIGAAYIDYLIADEIVIPRESIEFYSEKIIYLPFSYQANDDKKEISPQVFRRTDFGLPENNFIFCCFNNNYKITPKIFSIWMEVLKSVSASCLWIIGDNDVAKKNLITETVKHGIDPSRLIFSDRIKVSEHIGRHRLADLFLDTLPYNAHTTASDALWAGLPLLTLKGDTFPGRVGASLLNTIGLPELITYSLKEYRDVAIDLAHNPDKLTAIKIKLAENRLTTPLFNTKLFTNYLENAYQAAYDRYHAGLAPDHIVINP
jgi:protein O-GlcNAc transferase